MLFLSGSTPKLRLSSPKTAPKLEIAAKIFILKKLKNKICSVKIEEQSGSFYSFYAQNEIVVSRRRFSKDVFWSVRDCGPEPTLQRVQRYGNFAFLGELWILVETTSSMEAF